MKEFVVDFHFPWLPSRCKLCDKWGHTDEVCMIKGKGRSMEVEIMESPQHQPLGNGKETVHPLAVDTTESLEWRNKGKM